MAHRQSLRFQRGRVDPAANLDDAVRIEAVRRFVEDEEVGQRGGEMDVGRPLNRSGIEVGRDLGVIGFRHAGDLLGFQERTR